MKFIGNRTSYQNKHGVFSVVIAASVERFKESLLAAWLAAWTICGIYFTAQMFGPMNREVKLYLFVLLVFWAYYEYRIIKIYLWRKFGYESIKMTDDKLLIRNVIKGRGKTREFFLENIEGFSKLEISNAWIKTIDSSFWLMGNDYIYFMYMGKLVSFGKQLEPAVASELVNVMNRELGERKRKQRQVNQA